MSDEFGDICTSDALCGSHGRQHDFQLFVTHKCEVLRKFVISLEYPDIVLYSLL